LARERRVVRTILPIRVGLISTKVRWKWVRDTSHRLPESQETLHNLKYGTEHFIASSSEGLATENVTAGVDETARRT
jgi:hypothetical protein